MEKRQRRLAIATALVGLFLTAYEGFAVASGAQAPRALLRIDGHRVLKAFRYINPVPPIPTRVIFQDSHGTLWFGGYNGIYSYAEDDDKWTDYTNALGENSLTFIRRIAEDGKGRIWVFHDPDCARFPVEVPGEDRYPGTCAVLDNGRWRPGSHMLPQWQNSLGLIPFVQGGSGKIWFVTSGGLVVYDGSAWSGRYNPPEQLLQEYDRYRAAHKTDQDAESERLLRLSRDSLRSLSQIGSVARRIDPDLLAARTWASNVLQGIEDHSGNLWLFAGDATWKFEQSTQKWCLSLGAAAAYPLNSLYEDQHGRVWLCGTRGRLTAYEETTGLSKFYDLRKTLPGSDFDIEAVRMDGPAELMIGSYPSTSNGKLMVAMFPGNLCLNVETGEVRVMKDDEGNLVHPILSMAEDNRGRIWVGSVDQILVLGR